MPLLRPTAARRAQAIVEFALVLPLFALLLFAFIDFARLEFSYISLANATRETARVASISGNIDDNILDAFNNQAIIASDWDGAGTDSVVFTVTPRPINGVAPVAGTPVSCVITPSHGSPTVRGLLHSSSLDPAHCSALPSRTGNNLGGSIEIITTYHFQFNPLFQNRLTGILDASFMQQAATLSTTARAYIE